MKKILFALLLLSSVSHALEQKVMDNFAPYLPYQFKIKDNDFNSAVQVITVTVPGYVYSYAFDVVGSANATWDMEYSTMSKTPDSGVQWGVNRSSSVVVRAGTSKSYSVGARLIYPRFFFSALTAATTLYFDAEYIKDPITITSNTTSNARP